MKWRGARRSANVQDRRGFGRRAGRVAGGGGLAALIIIGLGILFPDLRSILTGAVPQPGQNSKGGVAEAQYDDEHREFAEVTVAYTEEVWGDIFRAGGFPDAGRRYPAPTLVLYSDRTDSGCGFATSAAGPFYCPADSTIYIDPTFYQTLAQQLGAPGDFAAAYVIAHEVAHHVQNVSGQLSRVYSIRLQASDQEANRLTVRIELQADCYAGVWAHQAQASQDILEEGDIEEALRAAHAVGDDVIQRMGGQRVDESKFTHGSAEQRKRWFMRGFEGGDVASCDTFTPSYSAL